MVWFHSLWEIMYRERNARIEDMTPVSPRCYSFNLNSNAIRIPLCFWLLSVCYFILFFVSTCTYIRGAYLTVRKYEIKSNWLGNGRDWLDYVCSYLGSRKASQDGSKQKIVMANELIVFEKKYSRVIQTVGGIWKWGKLCYSDMLFV